VLQLSSKVQSRCMIEDAVFPLLAIKTNSTSAIVTLLNVLPPLNHSWRQSRARVRINFSNCKANLTLTKMYHLHQYQCHGLLVGRSISKTLDHLMDPEVCAHFLVKSNILRQNSIKTFTIQMLSMRDTKV